MNDVGQPDPPSLCAGPVLTRRRLLVGAGAVAAVGVLGGGALDASSATTGKRKVASAGAGVAVMITCYGGNDGLNTVVPAWDPAYAAGRPTLGYHPSEVLLLGTGAPGPSSLGLNPALAALSRRYAAGQVAIVRGVGYPQQSLSHFQSMDIWQTASLGGVGPGWLGRWLDATGSDPMRAIALGASLPPALRGERSAATAITSATIQLPGRAPMLAALSACSRPGDDRSPLAAAAARSDADLLAVRSALASLTGTTTAPSAGGMATGVLAAQMATIATLVNAGAPTRVYQVSLESFDTHADEKAHHQRLLAELDAGIDTLLDAVASGPRAADVVVFTVSEFGRRVAQNASGGTDHGSAAPVVVAGHGVRGGLYGEDPSLTTLDDDGNLVPVVDFRSVYATVLDRVIGVDPRSILGGSWPTLPVV